MDSSIIEAFRGMHAATVYEAAGKLGDMSPEIRPILPGVPLLGTAFTVKCWPGDGAAFMRAVDEAAPGDVLVIDGGSSSRFTTWGGGSTIASHHRGLAGVVTNGAVRDVHVIRELGFQVYSGGIGVRGGLRNHRGWTGIPVSVGGVPVHPGDLVVGDDDGVVVVAAARIEEVLEKAKERRRREDEGDARLRAGESYSKMTGVA